MRSRWQQIGIVAGALFIINAIARFVTWKGGFATESQQLRIGFVAVIVASLLLIAAAAWWALRHPLGRLVADLGAATLLGATAAALIGPFFGGSRPFREGLAFFVGQFLLFGVLGGVGITLGFLAVVAIGKDWKSRGLKRYEERYQRKPHRVA